MCRAWSDLAEPKAGTPLPEQQVYFQFARAAPLELRLGSGPPEFLMSSLIPPSSCSYIHIRARTTPRVGQERRCGTRSGFCRTNAMLYLVLTLAVLVLTGCGSTIHLRPDSRWYAVESLQVEQASRTYDVSSERSGCCDHNSESGIIEVRLMRMAHFMDLSKISDDPAKMAEYYRTTEHGGVPLRLLDSGPLDLTLPGSARRLSVGQLVCGPNGASDTARTCAMTFRAATTC